MASVVLTVGMGAFLLLIHSSRLAVYLHKEYEFNMVQHEFEPLTPHTTRREGEGSNTIRHPRLILGGWSTTGKLPCLHEQITSS